VIRQQLGYGSSKSEFGCAFYSRLSRFRPLPTGVEKGFWAMLAARPGQVIVRNSPAFRCISAGLKQNPFLHKA
jgi:hypothetical protein